MLRYIFHKRMRFAKRTAGAGFEQQRMEREKREEEDKRVKSERRVRIVWWKQSKYFATFGLWLEIASKDLLSVLGRDWRPAGKGRGHKCLAAICWQQSLLLPLFPYSLLWTTRLNPLTTTLISFVVLTLLQTLSYVVSNLASIIFNSSSNTLTHTLTHTHTVGQLLPLTCHKFSFDFVAFDALWLIANKVGDKNL